MRALFSLFSCVMQRIQHEVEPRASLLETTYRLHHEPSAIPSPAAVIGGWLINLLFVSTLGAGGYWLSLQDWSMGGPVEMRAAGDSTLDSRKASVRSLSGSSDGKAFLSCSTAGLENASLLLLHRFAEEGAAQFACARPIPTGEKRIWKAVLLPDASAIVIVGESASISRIEIESGARTGILNVSVQECISALAVASDGSCLAIALEGERYRELRLCDPLSGQELLKIPGHSSSVNCMVFSDDDRSIATGSVDGSIRLWSRSTGELIQEFVRHEKAVAGVRFVSGMRLLASVGVENDDTLRLWDIDTGELLWQVSADQWGFHVLDVSPDGGLAATGGGDGDVILWDLKERVRLRSCSGHSGMIRALQFSPDGKTLTSASNDGTIGMWDVDSTELLSTIDVGTITSGPDTRK